MPIQLNSEKAPHITLPQYAIPAEILALTEDRGTDAASVSTQVPETTLKAMRRRYERAMDTLKGAEIYAFKQNPDRAASWKRTLETAHDSCSWLIKHEAALNARLGTHSKAAGSQASASSAGNPYVSPSDKTEESKSVQVGTPPPWRAEQRAHAEAKPMPMRKVPRSPNFPPPPPPPPPTR